MKRVLVAMLLLAAVGCTSDDGPRGRLLIATGGRGGVYYAYGQGIADAVTAQLPGLDAQVLATAASVENLRMIAGGDAEVAFTLADSAALAIRGEGPFDHPQPVRALARLYYNYVHLVVRAESPIRSLVELEGKVVSTGAPGSGTELIAGRLLGLVGLEPDADLHRRRLGIADSAARLADGTLDAFFWSGGLPTAAITRLNSGTGDIRILDLSGLVEPMRARYGEIYTDHTIPASAYHLSSAVPTIGVPNYLVVNEAMPEATAYALTRVLFERRDRIARAHPEARRLNRRAAIGTYPVELHAGAKRYYRESKL